MVLVGVIKSVTMINSRTFKNFGHKRQPVPGVTILWHGFLTFTFIGLGIEWKTIAKFIFGDDHGVVHSPWDLQSSKREDS